MIGNEKNKLIIQSMKSLLKSDGYIGAWLIDKFDDFELIETIHLKADRELSSILSGHKDYQRYDPVVLISMILIQIKSYDGSFYPHLEEYYENTFKLSFSDSRFQHIIRHMIKDTFSVEDNDQRVITHLLVQALVPLNYVSHFYEFVFDIYKYNYDYMIPIDNENNFSYEDTKNDLVKLFRYLFSMNSEKEDDNYEITVDNKYKIYKLIVSSKMAFSNETYLVEIIPVVINIMKVLDRDFWGKNPEKFILNDYYRTGFLEWKSTHADDEDEKTAKRSNKKDKEDNFRDKIIKYDIESRKLIFKTRTYQIVNYKAGSSVKIKVYNGENHLKTVENLIIREALGVVRIDPKLISVEDFVGQLSYKVFYNDSEIENSGVRLYQDIFFFDYKGDYLGNLYDYRGNALILSTDSLDNENVRLLDAGTYFLYAANVRKGFRLILGNEVIVSTKIHNDQILGKKVEGITCSSSSLNDVDVYSNITNLVTRINKDEFEKRLVFLNINGQNIKIDQASLQFTTNEGIDYLLINWDSLNLPSDFYDIDVIYGSKNKMSSFKFMYDSKASYTEIFEHGDVKRELRSTFFNEHYDRISNHELNSEVLFNMVKEFKLNNAKYSYIPTLRLPHYVIDDKKYYINKTVWFDDIESKLTINIQSIIEVSIQTTDGIFYQCRNENPSLDTFVFNRGDLGKFNNHKNDLIKIKIKSNQYKTFIITVLFRNLINVFKTRVVEINEIINFKVAFEGYNEMRLEVFDGNQRISSSSVKESTIIPLKVSKDRKYMLMVKEGVDDIFAKTPIKTVYTESFINVSLTTILNSKLRITQAQLSDDETNITVRNAFIDNLYVDNSQLFGYLYYPVGSRQVYFEALNPVRLEILDQLIHDGKERNFEIRIFLEDKDADGVMVNKNTNKIQEFGDYPYGLEFRALVQRR